MEGWRDGGRGQLALLHKFLFHGLVALFRFLARVRGLGSIRTAGDYRESYVKQQGIPFSPLPDFSAEQLLYLSDQKQ